MKCVKWLSQATEKIRVGESYVRAGPYIEQTDHVAVAYRVECAGIYLFPVLPALLGTTGIFFPALSCNFYQGKTAIAVRNWSNPLVHCPFLSTRVMGHDKYVIWNVNSLRGTFKK